MLSIWEKQSLISYDVIVVGAGITGLSTAISFKEIDPKLNVLVLEKHLIPRGASTKNAGFACFGSISELEQDLQIMGAEKMVSLVQDRWNGLKLLRKRLGDDAIDFQQKGGFELFKKPHSALEQLEKINSYLHPLFNESVFQVADIQIASKGFNGISHMIFNPFEGQIDTGKMFHSLYQLANEKGVKIITGAEITSISRNQVTADQFQFLAKAVAITTNGFTPPNMETDLQPGRGLVLFVNPEKPLEFEGTFHLEEGYYYFRDYYDKIIFGGGRNLDFETENTTEFGINETIKSKLIEDLKSVIIPGQEFEVEYEWSGIMAFGKTKQPVLKKHAEGYYMAVRLGGMGVALGSLLGKRLAEKIHKELL